MLLVTTALEQTWGTSERILFLGEWCKLYTRKQKWQARRYETLPYNWDDRIALEADNAYLTELYERILLDLTKSLNKLHRTSNSDKYWRILVGPWLGFFMQMCFQRWASIAKATRDYPVSHVLLVTNSKFHLIPANMLEFVSMFSGDAWNEYICGLIIQDQNKLAYAFIDAPKMSDSQVAPLAQISLGYRMKMRLLSAWNKLWSPFSQDLDCFFIATGLPRAKELALKIRLGQVPQYSFSEGPPAASLDAEQRKWQVDGKSQTEFESFLRKIIPAQIPEIYIEGYFSAQEKVLEMRWPKAPKLIFTSVGHVYDDLVKTYIASKVDQGSRLVIGQHGGGAFHAINFQTEHELTICDKYLSPGEGNTWHPKVCNVGQLFARRWNSDQSEGGLLVQLGTPRYSFSISTTTQSDDFNIYLDEQMRFVQSLPEYIRDEFSVRLTSTNNLWGNRERWEDSFPDVKIDPGSVDIHTLFSKAKVIICTYAGTTYNQTLAANAPTVIFWNRKYEQLHKSADSIFDELIRVGIFHGSPESAAAHISRIWDDVNDWWLSSEVQNVRERYCRDYAYLPDDSLQRLESALLDVIPKSR